MDWITAEEVQRAHAWNEFFAAGGYLDANGTPILPTQTPNRPPERPAAPITSIRRPRRWPKDVPRFETLPNPLPVPDELQTSFSTAPGTYVLIAGCASLLTSGVADPLVIGLESVVPIAYRTPPACWVLTLTFRHAPDEAARSGILSALDPVEDLDSMLLYSHLGPHVIAECLVAAGAASRYLASIAEHPVTGARLRAALMESGERDPDLVHALGLTGAKLPAGWGTRCAEALWSGAYPAELAADDTQHRPPEHNASRVVLLAAVARAVDDNHRNGLIRALATNPLIGTLKFSGLGGLIASMMGRAYPNEYRAALALHPGLREKLSMNVRLSLSARDPRALYVVGLRDSP